MSDLASDPRIGAELAGYRIERLLGRGGMSVVYLAEDLALGRKVALKLLAEELSIDGRFHERFRLESRLAAAIDHPNVIPVYEAGEADGQLFIAMRYVEGTDLRQILHREGALDPERAVDLVAQVAEGLDAAHARGLVHRDVKPSNVLVGLQGGREHVYLADFGLTKSAATPGMYDESMRLSGTTAYVAPEQIANGVADVSADIYSLGCVLFESLTGDVPYPRSSEFETLWAHVDAPPPKPTERRPGLPAALDAVVERAMAKDPHERFENARSLAAAARAALPATRKFGRSAIALAAVAAALMTGVVLAVVLPGSGGPESSPNAPTSRFAGGAVQRVDAKDMKLDATIKVSGEPIDVIAGTSGVWVLGGAGPSFHHIDPSTNELKRGPAMPGIETAIAAGGDSVWIASHGRQGEGFLVELDSERATVARTTDLRALARSSGRMSFRTIGAIVPDPIHAGAGFSGWLSDAAEGSLRQLRPGPAARRYERVGTAGVPLDLAVSGDRLWAVQRREVVELQIDRRAGRTRSVSHTAVAGTPIAVVADGRGAWLVNREGRLLRVQKGGRVALSVDINDGLPAFVPRGRPVDIALGEGSVWVLLSDGTVDRRDPRTAASLGSVDVGGNPVGLAVSEGSVWIAARGGARLRGLPRRYDVVPGQELSASGCPKARDECLHVLAPELRASDGTSALLEGVLREQRAAGGSIHCGGRLYRAPAVIDTRDPGVGRIRVARWGVAALRFERLVGAAATTEVAAGPPLCARATGQWIGTTGPLKGRTGSFTLTPPPRMRLTFRGR